MASWLATRAASKVVVNCLTFLKVCLGTIEGEKTDLPCCETTRLKIVRDGEVLYNILRESGEDDHTDDHHEHDHDIRVTTYKFRQCNSGYTCTDYFDIYPDIDQASNFSLWQVFEHILRKSVKAMNTITTTDRLSDFGTTKILVCSDSSTSSSERRRTRLNPVPIALQPLITMIILTIMDMTKTVHMTVREIFFVVQISSPESSC